MMHPLLFVEISDVAERLPDCHQREGRQPIGSGSSESERAKIIMAITSPLMNVTGIRLKCIARRLSEKFIDRSGRNGARTIKDNKEGEGY
jgi:hypothetical protein